MVNSCPIVRAKSQKQMQEIANRIARYRELFWRDWQADPFDVSSKQSFYWLDSLGPLLGISFPDLEKEVFGCEQTSQISFDHEPCLF